MCRCLFPTFHSIPYCRRDIALTILMSSLSNRRDAPYAWILYGYDLASLAFHLRASSASLSFALYVRSSSLSLSLTFHLATFPSLEIPGLQRRPDRQAIFANRYLYNLPSLENGLFPAKISAKLSNRVYKMQIENERVYWCLSVNIARSNGDCRATRRMYTYILYMYTYSLLAWARQPKRSIRAIRRVANVKQHAVSHAQPQCNWTFGPALHAVEEQRLV